MRSSIAFINGSNAAAWCGAMAQEFVADSRTCIRQLSTSGASAQRGFQSVLKKPQEKATILNRDAFLAWKESGFDVRVGETLIEGSILKSWEKKERSEAIQLQAELMGLVRGCDSVAELAMVVREVASHMSPETLVVSISRVAHLPLVSNGEENRSATVQTLSRAVPELLDVLLPLIVGHCGNLSSSQLASVLSAIARTGYRPHNTVTAALQSELIGDVGLQRVDASGPSDTAALMHALSRLAWGNAELWTRLGEATLAQLEEMVPGDAAKALRAASLAPGAKSSSGAIGPKSLLWVHAEQVALKRMSAYNHRDLSQVLLSLENVGASSGSSLRAAVDARLNAHREWSEVPPQAIVDYARSSALSLRRQQQRGGGADADASASSSMMQQACSAATQAVTYLNMRQIEQLLQAVEVAYVRSGSGGSATAGMPNAVSHLLGMISDVLRIRGLEGQQAGAVPTPAAHTAASAASSGRSGDVDTSCRVLLHLLRLTTDAGTSSSTSRAAMLESMHSSARKLLSQNALSPEAASNLLLAFALVEAKAKRSGAEMQFVESLAGVIERGAVSMSLFSTARALTALLAFLGSPPLSQSSLGKKGNVSGKQDQSRETEAVQRTCRLLADRLATSAQSGESLSGLLSPLALESLRKAVKDGGSSSGLSGHKLLGLL